MTSRPFARAGSGNSATGCSRQSELEPSACRVELPSKFQIGQLLEGRLAVELHDLRLAAQVRDGLVAVEPDVFELVLGHPVLLPSRFRERKKAPHTPKSGEASLPPRAPSSALQRGRKLAVRAGRIARARSRAAGRRCARPGASCGRSRTARASSVLELAADRGGSPRRARRARGRRGPGSPSRSPRRAGRGRRSTPRLAAQRRADLGRVDALPAPPRAGRGPTARSSGHGGAEHRRRDGERGDRVGAVEAGRPDDGAGERGRRERVEVGEQVLEAALDVQALAVRARDLAQGDDVHDRADERGRDDERRRGRPAGRRAGARASATISERRARAASAPFACAERISARRKPKVMPRRPAAAARAGPPRR